MEAAWSNYYTLGFAPDAVAELPPKTMCLSSHPANKIALCRAPSRGHTHTLKCADVNTITLEC